jgi:hypothetical protein
MFYRLLGKLFFLFYICPALRRVGSVLTDKVIADLSIWVRKQNKKNEEEARKSRRENHPAGTRRS